MDLSWLNLLTQDTRLITLDTALPQGLVVERFQAREALCESFRFDINCISASAFVDTAALIGQPVHLRLSQADGSRRAWHGYVTETLDLGADGGLARYRLVLESWMAFLARRRNTLIFQDLDALGICERIFADHPQAAYRFDVTQTLRPRSICTQYRETDAAFVTRLLAEEGLGWRFEHRQDGAPNEQTEQEPPPEQAQHTLVVFDKNAAQPLAEPQFIRFHRTHATESEDAFTVFTERTHISPNVVSLAAWKAGDVRSPGASTSATPEGLPALERYSAERSGSLTDNAQAEQRAALQLDGLRLPSHLFTAEGSVRHLAAGQLFTLTQHTTLTGQTFVPLVIEHEASNNLGSNAAALLEAGALEAGNYRQRLLAVPGDTPIVPAPAQSPIAPAADTARVVGLADEPLTATRDHQVRVQFDWQRGPTPNPGGLTDAASSAHPEGHAPGNERAGTWVRVAEASAGANYGHSFTPRIGAEVLIEYIDGDIDQPIIVGQLYNGEHTPPYAAGENAPANHIGTVSGIQTKGLDSSHEQHWRLDDAPGQLRHELHTSLAGSQLALGYLIEQHGASRGALQGQGFQLATNGWAALRAPEGLLLSSSARRQGVSTQMDVNSAAGQLAMAIDAARRLDDAAQQPGAQTTNNAQTELHQAIDPNQDGHYNAKVNGQNETKPTGTQRDGGDPVERFDKAHLLAEAPSTIALGTPNSLSAFAGEHLHLTSQDDAHIAAGATTSIATGEKANLYAHDGPVQVVAANGPTSIQAHDDAMAIQADQSVTVTSSTDGIEILAKDKIVLQAGQSSVTIQGANVTFACPGTFTAKGAGHPFAGAASNPAKTTALPTGTASLANSIISSFKEQNLRLSTKALINSDAFGQLSTDAQTAVLSQVQNYPDPKVAFNLRRLIRKQWFKDFSLADKQRALKVFAYTSYPRPNQDREIVENTLDMLLRPLSPNNFQFADLTLTPHSVTFGETTPSNVVLLNRRLIPADNLKLTAFHGYKPSEIATTTLAHEVSHAANYDAAKSLSDAVIGEYRASLVGYTASHGSGFSNQQAVERLSYIISPSGEYWNNMSSEIFTDGHMSDVHRLLDAFSKMTGRNVTTNNYMQIVFDPTTWITDPDALTTFVPPGNLTNL